MDWTQISTKQDLVDKLHRTTKIVNPTVTFESYNSWTHRVWRISQDAGNHKNKKYHFYAEFNCASFEKN